MATGVKISALTPATSFDSTDLIPIVTGGATESITHDVLMDDTQICKAWVNFNGTGTVAIRDDYNVSSITDGGVGNYTINFTNNMNNINYSPTVALSQGAAAAAAVALGQTGPNLNSNNYAAFSVSSLKIVTGNAGTSAAVDIDAVCVQVFGS